MSRLLCTCAAVLLLLAVSQPAEASYVTQTYRFTAADLMKVVYGDAASNETMAQYGLFDGGRVKSHWAPSTPGGNPTHQDVRFSHRANQASDFADWESSMITQDHRLTNFNLWGLNGRGAGYGEDYKPLAWVDHSSSSGWYETSFNYSDYWGNPPAGNHTDQFIGWGADTWDDAFTFNTGGLSSIKFEFTVTFDPNNWLWNQTTHDAPNDLYGAKTFWFGGWFDDTRPDHITRDFYSGNMVLNPIPEPSTLALLGVGLLAAGIGFIRRRRAQ